MRVRQVGKRAAGPALYDNDWPSPQLLPVQNILMSLFETSPDANLLVNEASQILAVNQAAENLFGYPRAELIGQPVDMLVPEARRAEHAFHRVDYFRSPRPRAMAEVHALNMALFARHKDGSTFPIEITLNPVDTTQGLRVHCVVRDERPRLQREHQLMMQSGMIRLLQEVAIAANEARSIENAFEFALNRLCSFLQWPLGHAMLLDQSGNRTGVQVWSSDIPRELSVFRAVTDALPFKPGSGLMGQVITTGQPHWYNHLSQHPNFRRQAEATQAGLRTALGVPVLVDQNVVGVLEFFHTQDIPANPNLLAVLPHIGLQLGRVVERQRSEEALRKNATQMQILMTSLPVLLWMIDRDGRLVMLEGKAVSTSGLEPDKLVGKNMFQMIDTRPDLSDALRRALNGEEVHTEFQSTNGPVFELFYTPYYNADGQVESAIGLALEITERKRMEAELEEVKYRLLDSIDSERVRLAQQLHDGPLQDLYGAYYQIQEIKAGLDENSQEITNRALQTIQGVNATLRVICGELHPNTLVHLGLQKAIRSHVERMRERADAIKIELDLENDQNILPHAVRLGIYRIFQQLVSNAALHASAQTIWVRLRVTPDLVTLEVQDDGKGFDIPKHWINLVRKGQLGLVSTVERVHGMHGKIEINSRPNQGTLVRVQVPVKA